MAKLPKFRVEALEKFVVRTVYEVEAASAQDAVNLCKSGNVAYESSEIEEGDEQWLDLVSIDLLT